MGRYHDAPLKEEVELKFMVIDKERNPPNDDSSILYLMRDDWNDYSFRTLFGAYYKGEYVGGVKIAFRNMKVDTPTIDIIPHEFETLSNEYYSLWSGIQACQAAYNIYEASGCNIFAALNDISYDLSLFDAVRGEDACRVSLMRGVSEFAIRGQLHRVVNGKAALTRYSFSFTLGSNSVGGNERIDFTVTPEKLPPTNVHVLIGRNGVGKTHLLRDIALAAHDGKAISSGRNLFFDVEQGGAMDTGGAPISQMFSLSPLAPLILAAMLRALQNMRSRMIALGSRIVYLVILLGLETRAAILRGASRRRLGRELRAVVRVGRDSPDGLMLWRSCGATPCFLMFWMVRGRARKKWKAFVVSLDRPSTI